MVTRALARRTEPDFADPVAVVRDALALQLEFRALADISQCAGSLPAAAALDFGEQARRRHWYRAAHPLLSRAAETAQDPLPALARLVQCDMELGQWTRGRAHVEAVLAREPRNRRMLCAKGKILWKCGERDLALAALAACARVSATWPTPWIETARIHAAGQDWPQAAAAAEAAIKRGEDGEEMRGVASEAWFALGRPRPACRHVAVLARRAPNLVARMVRMYARMDQPLTAAHVCQALIEARGPSPEVIATARFLTGWLMTKADAQRPDTAGALALLSSAGDLKRSRHGLLKRLWSVLRRRFP